MVEGEGGGERREENVDDGEDEGEVGMKERQALGPGRWAVARAKHAYTGRRGHVEAGCASWLQFPLALLIDFTTGRISGQNTTF